MLRPPIISADFWKSITSFLMCKRPGPYKPNLKRNRLKSMKDVTTSEGSEIEENISLKIIMDKLNAMEARIEDNFTQVHSLMTELRYAEFKQQIDGVSSVLRLGFL